MGRFLFQNKSYNLFLYFTYTTLKMFIFRVAGGAPPTEDIVKQKIPRKNAQKPPAVPAVSTNASISLTGTQPKNSVTILHERYHNEKIEYRELARMGPDHKPSFKISVKVRTCHYGLTNIGLMTNEMEVNLLKS
jgi:hypothetical protein